MRQFRLRGLAAVAIAALVGCGGGGAVAVSPVAVLIPGDAPTDGYVENTLAGGLVAVQGDGIRVQSPILAVSPERRGFASFSIATIPVASLVNSARVNLFVNTVIQDNPGTPVTLDVYHVFYGSPLLASDFNTARTPVVSLQLTTAAHKGRDLPLPDLTPELQLDVNDPTHGFFQLMLIATNGVVEVEDSENAFATGFLPQLDATYFP